MTRRIDRVRVLRDFLPPGLLGSPLSENAIAVGPVGRMAGRIHELEEALKKERERSLRQAESVGDWWIDHAVEVLNVALDADPDAMRQLIENRVPCNTGLAGHPTIQVKREPMSSTGYSVGMIGIINGICGTQHDGWGHIAIEVDADNGNRPLRFVRLDR